VRRLLTTVPAMKIILCVNGISDVMETLCVGVKAQTLASCVKMKRALQTNSLTSSLQVRAHDWCIAFAVVGEHCYLLALEQKECVGVCLLFTVARSLSHLV